MAQKPRPSSHIRAWFQRQRARAARFLEAIPQAFQKIKVKRPGAAFVQTPSTTPKRASFEGPAFDMAQITIAYERDDYVRQAVDKYAELCAKEGWRLVGPSEAAIEYVRARFAWMETFSGRAIDDLLNQITFDLIKYGNAFLAKARMPRQGSLPFKAQAIGKKPPVAYYEPLNPATIQVARTANGEAVAYQQDVGIGQPVIFAPDDIVHFAWKRDSGNFFGVPWIWPAIEDVKLLRVLESNMETLIRKYVFPILHAKVGMPTPGYEAEDEDIEKAKEDFNAMPPEGIWVTPERYNLAAIGMENTSLDIKPYLEYMEKRVFSGLGVSETVMGRGGTANRGTASQQTRQMHDRATSVQKTVEQIFNLHVIDEILIEGGFDPITNRGQVDVSLRYNDIDIDSLFKRETAAIFKFEHNATSFEEMREELGRDPEADLSRFHLNLVAIPRALAGIAAADASAETDTRQQPANQYGKKQAKTSDKANEAWVQAQGVQPAETVWARLADQVVDEARRPLPYPRDLGQALSRHVDLAARSVRWILRGEMGSAVIRGAQAAARDLDRAISGKVDVAASVARIEPLLEADLARLARDLSRRLAEISRDKGSPEALKAAVGSSAYRVRFIARMHLGKAYHLGFAREALAAGRTHASVAHSPGACAACQAVETVDLTKLDLLERLPPFHPGDCRCTLSLPVPNLFLEPTEEGVTL